jgi:cell division protease FtsH
MFLPEEDRYSLSRRQLISQICSLYGGRIAEEMTLGADGVTTGASNDIQRATEIARNMVTKWGLSEKLGPLLYDEAQEEVFLGKSAGGASSHVAGSTRNEIDEEIRAIIDSCYAQAEKILEENRSILDAMADALMKYETIDSDQIDDLMDGKAPREPKGWSNGPSGGDSSGSSEQGERSGAGDSRSDDADSTVVNMADRKDSDDGTSEPS